MKSMIMTVTLPDGTETEVMLTQSITSHDFYSFKGHDLQSGQQLSVRVESEENYEDRKKRNC